MKTCPMWFCVLLLLTAPHNATALDKSNGSEEDLAYSDKAFSDQIAKGYLGPDWSPWTGIAAAEGYEVIPLKKDFASPDKRFSAQTILEDRTLYVVIKDARTGQSTRLPYSFCPVFALEWSPDSQTLLTVGHTSMSSLIELIHWDGRQWQQLEVSGPVIGNNDKSHVVSWKFESRYIEATYIVDNRTERGTALDFHKCTCHIDPATGKLSDETRKVISQKEFLSLRTNRN